MSSISVASAWQEATKASQTSQQSVTCTTPSVQGRLSTHACTRLVMKRGGEPMAFLCSWVVLRVISRFGTSCPIPHAWQSTCNDLCCGHSREAGEEGKPRLRYCALAFYTRKVSCQLWKGFVLPSTVTTMTAVFCERAIALAIFSGSHIRCTGKQ